MSQPRRASEPGLDNRDWWMAIAQTIATANEESEGNQKQTENHLDATISYSPTKHRTLLTQQITAEIVRTREDM